MAQSTGKVVGRTLKMIDKLVDYDANTLLEDLKPHLSKVVYDASKKLGGGCCVRVGDLAAWNLRDTRHIHKGFGPTAAARVVEMMLHIGHAADSDAVENWTPRPVQKRKTATQPDLLSGVGVPSPELYQFRDALDNLTHAVECQTVAIRILTERLPPIYAPPSLKLGDLALGGLGSGCQGQTLGGGLPKNVAG